MRKYFKHILIAVFSVLMLAIIALQVAAVGGILWLRSDNGQQFVQNQLASAMQDSPYKVKFSHFSYSFPQGLRINDLNISDESGAIADLDYVVLRPKILPLALKNAGLSVNAGTLVLYRIPESAEEEVKEEEVQKWLEPFTLPDLYFNRFALNDLYIDTLDIREGVMGDALQFTPRLAAHIDMRNGIALDLDWSARSRSALPEAIPERLSFNATLDPQILDLALDKFIALASAYEITAEGALNLGGTGGANLSGQAALPQLKDQGLGNIEFSAQLAEISDAQDGKIEITSTYQDMPLSLTSDFVRGENTLALNNIVGTAPDLALSGDITLDLETTLASGEVKADIGNLETYSKLASMDIGGAGNVILNLIPQNGVQGANVNTALTKLRFEAIRADTIELKAGLPDVAAIYPDSLQLNGTNIVVPDAISISKLAVSLTESGQDNYAAKIDMRATAQGEALHLSGGAALSGLRAQIPAARDINLNMALRDQTLKITGAASQENLDVKASINNLPLEALPADIPVMMRNMALNVNASLTGTPALPVIETQISTAKPFSPFEGTALELSLNGGYNNGQARADIKVDGEQIERFEGTVSLPMKLSLMPYALSLPQNTPLSGSLIANANIREIALLFLPPDQTLEGDLSANASISGTIAAPAVRGDIALNDGLYRNDTTGTVLRDLELQAQMTQDSLNVATISAHDGEGGTLTGSGQTQFNRSGSAIEIALNNFHLMNSEQADGYVTSDLEFRGSGAEYILSGTVNPEDFNINIPERFHSSIPQLNVIEKPQDGNKAQVNVASVIRLDINVEADNRIFVRGWGLDAEFGGALNITGDLSAPLINGSFSSIRGRYEEFGKRFDLERASLRFQGTVPPSPYLDIVAVTNTADVQASINLSGRFQKPELTLSSVPSLPQDEILARILFGRDMSRITPFQAIQLKNTLDRFTGNGGGGFDPASLLRSATGLDDIRVDTDEEGAASVGVGKYLTDKVYLEFEKGSGETSGAAKIQVEVTPNINVESEVGQDAQAGGGVFWKWDY